MNRLTKEDRLSAHSKTGKPGAIVLWRTQQSLLPMEELARAAGLHIGLVEQLAEYGVIEPAPGIASPILFPVAAIDRLRCVVRLRRDLGVNLAGAAVIVEMRERLRSLRAELERFHKLAEL
jgi:chaperone modulatory protein CbpM